jgi:predicted ArsR family transcriptional regulator
MERQTSTRRQILELLKKRGGMTAKDIGATLGITSMAVRRHLAALERDDLITSTTVRRPMGRPTFVYSLTLLADDLFPKNYPQLTVSLLEDLRSLDGEEKVDLLFRRRAERLVATYAPRMEGKSFAERVQEMARIMDENGYIAHADHLGDHTYRLSWHNCAIYKIAQHCPEACTYEVMMLQHLLGAEVTRDQHVMKGDGACSYLVHPAESTTETTQRSEGGSSS